MPASEGAEQRLRLPFSEVDEVVHLLDAEAAPWSIQLEIHLSGRLDEERLRAAVSTGLLRHPLARARKRPARAVERRWEWEIAPRLDIDPVGVVDCPDDAALAAARAELQSLAVPLAESPPLRVRVARHPGGDVVMLNVNHAASDAFGCIRMVRSIARAYRGEPDPVPPLAQARDLSSRVAGRNGDDRVWRLLTLTEKLRDLALPPARIAPIGNSDAPGYGFHHVRVSRGRTERIIRSPRGRATVNDVLLAALHLAIDSWNAGRGRRSGRISVLMPVNLRAKGWEDDIVGNISLPVRVSTTRRHRLSPAATFRAVSAQTGRMKERGTALALTEILWFPAALPGWAKRSLPALLWVTGDRFVDTAMLSNLGRLADPPRFGLDAGETTQVWFSPPARMPLGLAIGAVTVGDRLHLSFRYRHRLLGAEAASRFAGIYLAAVDDVIAALGPS